jgi:hypothetical protein
MADLHAILALVHHRRVEFSMSVEALRLLNLIYYIVHMPEKSKDKP